MRERVIFWLIFYFIAVLWYFRRISYRCCMGIYGEYNYSLKNFLIALVFPISIIFIFIGLLLESRKSPQEKKEEFEKFKKKRIKEIMGKKE